MKSQFNIFLISDKNLVILDTVFSFGNETNKIKIKGGGNVKEDFFFTLSNTMQMKYIIDNNFKLVMINLKY